MHPNQRVVARPDRACAAGYERERSGLVSRVCYRNEDESGIRWTEATTEAEPLRHRRIRTYDLVGFPFGALARSTQYDVHQDYESLDADRTKLTFRSNIERGEGLAALAAWPITKGTYVILGMPTAQATFEWNLANIAEAVESRHERRPYERPHPYDPSLPWEERPLRWWWADRWRHLVE